MKKLLLVRAIIIGLSFASCKKEELPKKEKTYKEIHDLHKSKLKM